MSDRLKTVRSGVEREGAAAEAATAPRLVDVVIVSYNSGGELRGCVEELLGHPGTGIVVVDNASQDESLQTVADLPVTSLSLATNQGFAHGCNAGVRAGRAPYILFLNPDGRLGHGDLDRLLMRLEEDERIGIVGPKILDGDGALAYSQRRFPRLRSTYAHALFLHRLFPRRAWTGELIKDTARYESAQSPEWISGACMLARRSVIEELGGFDDRFFLYCEDKDLCQRIRALGHDVAYEPGAVAHHEGGRSAPRTDLLPVLAESRIRYARKHFGRPKAAAERAGIALGAFTHMIVSRGGRQARAGHARALARALLGREVRRRAAG